MTRCKPWEGGNDKSVVTTTGLQTTGGWKPHMQSIGVLTTGGWKHNINIFLESKLSTRQIHRLPN